VDARLLPFPSELVEVAGQAERSRAEKLIAEDKMTTDFKSRMQNDE